MRREHSCPGQYGHFNMLKKVFNAASRAHVQIRSSPHVKFRSNSYNAELSITNNATKPIEIFWQHEKDQNVFLSKGILKPGTTWRHLVRMGHTFFLRDTETSSVLDIISVPKRGVNEILFDNKCPGKQQHGH